MEDLGWFPESSTVRFGWDTTDRSGASITRATNGSIRIYKDGSTTERASSSGITDTEDFDSVTGLHRLTIDLNDNTTAGFYSDGSLYEVALVGATIDGVSDINRWLFRFRIGTAPANVTQINGDATAADNLEAAYDGAGYAGGTIKQMVDAAALSGDDGAALRLALFASTLGGLNGRLQSDSMEDGLLVGAKFADGFLSDTKIADGAITAAKIATNAIDADAIASDAVTEIQNGLATAAALTTLSNTVGVAGAGLTEAGGTGDHLTAIPWNAAWDAEVQSEAADALNAYDGPTSAELDARTLLAAEYATAATQTTILNRIGSFAGSGVNTILGFFQALMRSDATTPSDLGGTYDDATDSLQAIRDRGDAEWTTGGDDSGPGPYGVVVNVKSGGVNLQSANVRATNGSETYRLTTDSSGNATYSLPADTWNFYVYKANYVQDSAPLTIVVTADDLTGNNITMTYDPPGQSLTEEDPTMTATFLTMHDVACHLRDILGGDDSEEKNRLFRRAIRLATDDFFSEDGLKESLVEHRVVVQDSYATGTVEFDLTGGSSERLITLTDGTFPSWAGRASIIIDNEHYRVTSRLSNTTLQLDETLCPTADVASGTSYTLYQDAYLLPADFGALYSPVDKNGWDRRYVSEEDWLRLTTESRIGDDYRYTIMHDDRVPGRYALRFYGYPTESRTLTFLYKRKRKTPVLAGTETNSSVGTIAYTNGSATITGTNTVFSDAMVGAVLRIGDATNVPTDAAGDYPYLEEHVIGAVASATSLTLKTAVGLTTGSSKKYRISDPVTFDRGNQLALLKGAEAQYHELVNSSADNVRDARMAYERAKVRCRDDQSKHREHWSPVTGATNRGAGRPSVNVNAPS